MTETLSLSDATEFLIEQAKKYGADAAESFGVDSINVSAECRLQKTETLEYAQTSAVDLRVFYGPYCGLADPALLAEELPDLDMFDAEETTSQKLLDLALATEDAALSVKGVTQSDGAGAGVDKSHIIMASTTGFRREYDRSSASFSVSVIASDENGNKETDYD